MPRLFSRYIFILILTATAFATSAEIVSQKEAKKVARLFFNDAYSQVCPEPEYVFNGKRLTTDRLFTPFYVFNSPEGGFVIIAADNKAFPILGYALLPKGKGFDKDNLTADDRNLLTGFARDIELIRFDARYPYEAAEAWENIPAAIHSILYSPAILADGYLRYRPSDEKMWIVRERAVEFPYQWPKTDEELRLERLASEPDDEYIPFAFYDSFIAETRSEQEARAIELEEKLHPSKPIVKSLGGAHFIVDTPLPTDVADIYNAEGQLMKRVYLRGLSNISLNLSELPNGFYFAILRHTYGSATGIKLYR